MDTNEQTLIHSPIALAYARSLLELANERHQANEVGEEMKAIRQIVAENPQLKEFLSNPSIGAVQRLALIDSLFKGQASDLVYNLIRVANEKHRAGLLGDVAALYLKLLDQQLGNVDVQVTSAQELDASQEEAIHRRVGQLLGKNPILHKRVDDAIIGGLIVRVGDKVLDASVKTQLGAMRKRLLAGV